ncbi:DNA (cytosine-5)-methyltransferase 1 [Sphingomonas gellani]|uniref:DNA (cytosine-5-)-methyltransferase n=1 Tax=Sphingomonas gellani TaxID=1166340 RepID=A0A1H7ZXJ2_9SPHN|nr:DNA cytosine methyltransferase [Sphingomonas gellani]SEM62219.1 DNA (cytosine-5)-methyltransferase 1 [Sphingomonas gellani]
MRPLVIDNFAGGGGASTGIARAIGREPDVAINHDPEAVAMHVANHPTTRHYCQSILAVDPLDATGGAPVALAWFSPDCKHHSKAKGGKPREKNIRDLAWVVVHWAERLLKATPDGRGAPQVIMLENVEEFRRWGPLDAEGMPIKERQGEEFDLWVRRLRRLGYKVQYRELRACDYGAPTSRKRLYLIARRDGLPIVWPTPTHGKPDSVEVRKGKLLSYRTAAECIDWSIPCPSIFDRTRPLKPATNRRIAHGVMRYVVNAAKPFIVGTAFTNTRAARVFDPQDPLRTATSQPEHGVVDAAIVPITHTQNSARSHDPAEPLRTITTANGGEFARATATIAPIDAAFIGQQNFDRVGRPADEPLTTATVRGTQQRLTIAAMAPLQNGERRPGEKPREQDINAPVSTIATGGKHSVVVAHLEKFSENSRGRPASEPMDTVMAGAPRHAAVTAFLSHFYTSNTNGGQGDPTHPAKTITAGGQHHGVVCAHMEQANTGGMLGRVADKPLTTVTTTGAQQRLVETVMVDADALPPEQLARAVQVAAFLVKYYGSDRHGQAVDVPLHTIPTRERFAVVTVTIDATTYVIVDIGMRMLTPRELANAQGFPADYILAAIGPNDKPLTKSSQIAKIGNSVCPDVAEALVRANLPALCANDTAEEVAA